MSPEDSTPTHIDATTSVASPPRELARWFGPLWRDLSDSEPIDDETEGVLGLGAWRLRSNGHSQERETMAVGTSGGVYSIRASWRRSRQGRKSDSWRLHVGSASHSLNAQTSCLRLTLEAEPLESGVSHPGQSVLEDCLRIAGNNATSWLLRVIYDAELPIAIAADILRLAARTSALTPKARVLAVRRALSSPDVRLRDAGIQASEKWIDESVLGLLEAHRDPCGWLDEYRQAVLRDYGR